MGKSGEREGLMVVGGAARVPRAPALRRRSSPTKAEVLQRTARRAGLLLALLFGAGLPGCVTLDLIPSRKALEETLIYGETGPKVLLLEIDGVISAGQQSGLFGPGRESSVARVREQLDRARHDPDIQALIVRIDTPGGGVTASELVYQEILRFKQERRLPVVAQLMGTATSGGYYVAMAADQVVAHPTTITGSIGVIFLGVNVSGLMQKIGVENQTITGGLHKDAGSPLRPMTADERQHFQNILDDLHARFREVVVRGRPGLDAERVAALADGRVYSARQALENGLVDRLGGLEDTVAAIAKRTGNAQLRVVSYHRPREWRRNLYSEAPSQPQVLKLDLGSLLGPLQRPGFHYLWWPGS